MSINTNKARGFTLIELLVVIAIIGILSSVVLASLSTARAKSRDARRIADIDQLRTALEVYFDSNSSYPNTGGPLATGGQFWSAIAPVSPTGIGNLTAGTTTAIVRIPTAPSATGNYYYCAKTVSSSTTCDGVSGQNSILAYIIAADLERIDNNALKTDADVTGAVNYIYGSDSAGCLNTATGYCYDITN